MFNGSDLLILQVFTSIEHVLIRVQILVFRLVLRLNSACLASFGPIHD